MSASLMDRADGTKALAYALSGGVPWHRDGFAMSDEQAKDYMFVYNNSGFADLTMIKQELALYTMKPNYADDGSIKGYTPTFDRKAMSAFRALVRKETGEVFGVSSDDYGIVTPLDMLETLEPVRLHFSGLFESALLTYGGREMSASIRLPEMDIRVGDDKLNPYLFAHTTNDGTGRLNIFDTMVRAICRNTVRAALSTRNKAAFSLSVVHREGNVKRQLADAKSIMANTIRSFEDWGKVANELLNFKMSDAEFDIFRDVIFPMPEVTPRKNARIAPIVGSPIGDLSALVTPVTSEPVMIKRRNERVAFFNSALADERDYTGDNAWAAYNAVTGFSNHGMTYQKSINPTADKRLDSIMFGKANDLNMQALNVLTSMGGIKIG